MDTRFTFRDFAHVFALSILLYAGFVALFAFFPITTELIDNLHPTISFLIQYALQFVILFFPLWIFVVDKYAVSLADFGFKKVKLRRLMGAVAVAYLVYIAITLLVLLVSATYQLEIPGYQSQESYIQLFGTEWFSIAIAFSFIVVIAPVLEEIFFRGFIYRVFTKTWPIWLGSVLTALIFALLHFQIHSFFPLFLLGLILNVLYQRTQSLWVPIAFHVMNNLIAFSAEIYFYKNPESLQQLEQISAFLYNEWTLFSAFLG